MARDRIDSDIIFDLPTVSGPAISPDGALVAYTLGSADRAAMRASSHIELVPFAGGDTRSLTAGPLDVSPLFSPDGTTLAFLRSERDDDGKPGSAQVWLIAIAGGEAAKLTNLDGGVVQLAWSPDGTAILCVSDVDPDAPPQGDNGSIPRPKRVDRIYYRADGLGWRGNSHRQLFSTEVASGATRQLTRGDHDSWAPVYSPDGKEIAFASSDRSAQRQRRLPGWWELCIVSTRGGAVERRVVGLAGLGPIAWSPDGRRLAYVSGGPEYRHSQAYLWTIDRRGGEPRRLTSDSIDPTGSGAPLADPPPLTWGPRRIVFAASANGSGGLFSATPSGSKVEAVRAARELTSEIAVTPDARRAVSVASTLRRPAELAAIEIDSGETTQLTSASAGYLRSHRPGATERFFVQRGGLRIECWLTLPPEFNPRRKYPLVLEVHGGPNGFFGNGWYPLHQMLASAGYLVLWTNPRGSATYGRDFLSRVFGDWGGEDYEDLMAAVDHVLERPYVDQQRLAVHGYSYGGFMSSWIVGHTDRFKSAVVAAPVTNLLSMYGTTDAGVVFGERQWGGPPWSNLDEYMSHSPITYVQNVKTPVLLLHGEADIRCPIAQSEEYYVALKRLGKHVEFVRFPGGYHGFVRGGHPAMRKAYFDHVLEWFERTLR